MVNKDGPQGKADAAQPLLPHINLARLLTPQPTWCGCDCEECPPWLHYSTECVRHCRRMELPPTCNTGVAPGGI